MVGRSSRRSGTWRETLPEVQNRSGVPPGVPEPDGRPSRKFGSGRDPFGSPEVVGRHSRRSGSGWKTLPEVRKWLRDTPEGPEVSGDRPGLTEVSVAPPGDPEMLGRPSRMSGSCRKTLPEIWKWSGDPPKGLEVVGRLSRRSGSGRETLPDVWKSSGDPPKGPEVVGRPSQKFGSGRETLPEVWKWSGDHPKNPDVVGRPTRRTKDG